MILETCQLLCSVWHMKDPTHSIYKPSYRLTHKNHPCAIWARTSRPNYVWLCTLGKELCKEYTFRYGKIHKCQSILNELGDNVPPGFEVHTWTEPPQAMPDEYKKKNSIFAYRKYYKYGKTHLHYWKKRNVPFFIMQSDASAVTSTQTDLTSMHKSIQDSHTLVSSRVADATIRHTRCTRLTMLQSPTSDTYCTRQELSNESNNKEHKHIQFKWKGSVYSGTIVSRKPGGINGKDQIKIDFDDKNKKVPPWRWIALECLSN